MYRYKFNELRNWKNSKDRKPLIIRGQDKLEKHGLCKNLGKMNMKNVHI